MDALVVAMIAAVVLSLVFDVTNGFHDAAVSIAGLVASRVGTPGAALVLATVFNMLGPLLAGTAVADTVGSILDPAELGDTLVGAVIAALVAGLVWNVVTWRLGLPTSSSHALVGGLVGAGLVAGGADAVDWGGMDGLHPVGVIGAIVVLAVSPLIGVATGVLAILLLHRVLRRARRSASGAVGLGTWGSSALLAFGHGANDAQKTMGVITAVLVAGGALQTFEVPTWVRVTSAIALSIGTALGGWRIVRTLGRGIYRLKPVDAMASQGGSAIVILSAAAVGGPVSTTHVVASAVVGVGTEQRRHHVHWRVVKDIVSAWVVTMPVTAALAGLMVAGARLMT